MGRKKVISIDSILDAAERVIGRFGATKLTIDAVAIEAGISKASVLYVHKTKQLLLEALVNRAIVRDNELHRSAEAAIGDVSNLTLRGRLEVARTPPPDDFRPVALSLSSAIILDPELRKSMQSHQQQMITKILETSENPRAALLGYLALEGFKFLDFLDFYKWSDTERAQILQEIDWLAEQSPLNR